MSKNKMLAIGLLMAFALIGLISLQVNWIRHDYAIREEKFGQLVTAAINNAIARIDTRESIHIISRNVGDSLLEDSVKMFYSENDLIPTPEPIEAFAAEPPEPPEPPEMNSFTFVSDMDSLDEEQLQIISQQMDEDTRVIVKAKGSKGSQSTVVTTVTPDEEWARKQALEEEELAQQEFVRSQEQFERSKIQLERSKEKEDLLQKKSDDQQRIHRKAQKLNKVFEKMAVEYERRAFKLSERISPPMVDSIVGIELKNYGVQLPYSISLLNGNNDSIVWQRKVNTDAVSKDKEFAALLFPDDITNRRDLVKITFADTFSYFMSSMWIMLLSSAVFTMIVIFAFSYTLYIIFRQKKLSEIKNDFINNMTHEFKTPIATIRIATEAISNPEILKDETKIKHYARIIRDENDRMNSHVENILQMAQFDKKSFAQDVVRTDMDEVILHSIEMMKLQTEKLGGQIEFKQNAGNAIINADPSFIGMVIINLLDNALKYTDKSPVIEIETTNQENYLVISIQDHGIGMKPEMCKKIFEKFYRVSSGNLHNVKGFGLGLSYVKAIVTSHNGSISAQSELGKGSTFIISLPLVTE